MGKIIRLCLLTYLGTFLTVLTACQRNYYPGIFNLDIEEVDSLQHPVGWRKALNGPLAENYTMDADSITKYAGKYSIRVSSQKSNNGLAAIFVEIPSHYSGKQIVIRGMVKTEDVKNGYTGLWMRLTGEEGAMGNDQMQNRGLTGTNDWKELKISLPFSAGVEKISVGLVLYGTGTVWADNLSVEIDGVDISKAQKKQVDPKDTAYANGSGIHISPGSEDALTALGEVWGFLKYHLPAVKSGQYNWDAELIKFLPRILASTKRTVWMRELESWVGQYPLPDSCNNCNILDNKSEVQSLPDYGNLFAEGYLTPQLVQKLRYILNNSISDQNYYIGTASSGSPKIRHEKRYENMLYPDDAFRLIALYRFWSVIQYFFPYKDVSGENWPNVLREFLPVFLQAKDATEYNVACLRLIGKLHDSHAGIFQSNQIMESYKGNFYPPVSLHFVENSLVAGTFMNDSLAKAFPMLKRGTVIMEINGKPVSKCVQDMADLIPSSNTATLLRDLSIEILRGNSNSVKITIQDEHGKPQQITLPRFSTAEAFYNMSNERTNSDGPPFVFIKNDIGYIRGNLTNKDAADIQSKLAGTKGLIFDLRKSFNSTSVFDLVSELRNGTKPFAIFSKCDVQRPGLFLFSPQSDMKYINKKDYQGKIIILVNENTQSSMEYLAMFFQSLQNVITVGSTTAGTDGNVSEFFFPGRVSTFFSGIGVFYPDHSRTQRTGVRIDHFITPTIKGFADKKDEVLEYGLSLFK